MCLDYNAFEINKKYCGQEAHLFKKKKKRNYKSNKVYTEGENSPVFLPEEFHGQRSLVGLQSMGLQSQTRLNNSHV